MENCSLARSEGNGENENAGTVEPNSQELRNYDSVHYLSDVELVRTCKVILVHFVAQTALVNGGNHWNIWFQIGSKEAVHMNMVPGDLLGAPVVRHGYRGRIDVSHGKYYMAKVREATVTVPATQGHSVGEFIDAIVDAGNHEYDFTAEGRGCTGWILDQFHLFVRLSLIRPGLDGLETAINMQWIDGRPVDEWPVTRGFYMRDTRGGWGSSSGEVGNGRRMGIGNQ